MRGWPSPLVFRPRGQLLPSESGGRGWVRHDGQGTDPCRNRCGLVKGGAACGIWPCSLPLQMSSTFQGLSPWQSDSSWLLTTITSRAKLLALPPATACPRRHQCAQRTELPVEVAPPLPVLPLLLCPCVQTPPSSLTFPCVCSPSAVGPSGSGATITLPEPSLATAPKEDWLLVSGHDIPFHAPVIVRGSLAQHCDLLEDTDCVCSRVCSRAGAGSLRQVRCSEAFRD